MVSFNFSFSDVSTKVTNFFQNDVKGFFSTPKGRIVGIVAASLTALAITYTIYSSLRSRRVTKEDGADCGPSTSRKTGGAAASALPAKGDRADGKKS